MGVAKTQRSPWERVVGTVRLAAMGASFSLLTSGCGLCTLLGMGQVAAAWLSRACPQTPHPGCFQKLSVQLPSEPQLRPERVGELWVCVGCRLLLAKYPVASISWPQQPGAVFGPCCTGHGRLLRSFVLCGPSCCSHCWELRPPDVSASREVPLTGSAVATLSPCPQVLPIH